MSVSYVPCISWAWMLRPCSEIPAEDQSHSNIFNQRILSLSLSLSPTIFLPLSHNKDLQSICHFPGSILGTSCILNHLIFTTTLWETASNIPIFPGQNWGINKRRNRSKGNSQDSSLGNLIPEFKLLGITISCLLIHGTVLGRMHMDQEHKYLRAGRWGKGQTCHRSQRKYNFKRRKFQTMSKSRKVKSVKAWKSVRWICWSGLAGDRSQSSSRGQRSITSGHRAALGEVLATWERNKEKWCIFLR